jgi:putative membrane protein
MGYGFMGWMPFMGLFWLLVLVLIVVAIAGGFRTDRTQRRSGALDILEERYARGEIGRDEYLQKKQDITGQPAKS